MVVRITDAMLATVGSYDEVGVNRARRILEAAGLTVELHGKEVQRIQELREKAAHAAATADRMEAMGPMPPCTCEIVADAGAVKDTHGCPLGHRPGEIL